MTSLCYHFDEVGSAMVNSARWWSHSHLRTIYCPVLTPVRKLEKAVAIQLHPLWHATKEGSAKFGRAVAMSYQIYQPGGGVEIKEGRHPHANGSIKWGLERHLAKGATLRNQGPSVWGYKKGVPRYNTYTPLISPFSQVLMAIKNSPMLKWPTT